MVLTVNVYLMVPVRRVRHLVVLLTTVEEIVVKAAEVTVQQAQSVDVQ
jgi:hypothetical protein